MARRIGGGLALLLTLTLLVALAFALLYGVVWALKGQGGFWAEAWRLLFTPPYSPARLSSGLAIALLLVAGLFTPLAWAETRAVRRFARREAELRQQRPLDAVTPYEGDDGEGVAFDGPDGRLLLLRPPQGLGAPVEVVVAAPTPTAAPPEAP